MVAENFLDRWRFVVIEKLRKLELVVRRLPGVPGSSTYRELHTRLTFRATVDAVIPRTPELEAELGPEHVPGGNDIDLAEFLIEYVDGGFQLGLPHVGPIGNAPLAKPVANVLDTAALALLARGDNEDDPKKERAATLLDTDEGSGVSVTLAAGPFARLSRQDRLRAISLLDQIETSVTLPEETLLEFDGGLVGQLVVGFTALIYYSEWEGYDEFDQPPSERTHSNDPEDVQSWRQTGFPGFEDGYSALRGYLGTPDGSLGAGETWTTIEESAESAVNIYLESGSFRENEYDTSDYEEPYPESVDSDENEDESDDQSVNAPVPST